MLHVSLNRGIFKLSTDKTLGIKDGVGWVDCNLVLCRVTNQPLSVGESDIRGGCSVSLIIGNDFNLSMLENAHTGVGSSEINPNSIFLSHFTFFFVFFGLTKSSFHSRIQCNVEWRSDETLSKLIDTAG